MINKTDSVKALSQKILYIIIGLIIGLVLGIAGTLFVSNHNPKDEHETSPSIVFERIVAQDELVSASQNYNITDKFGDPVKFFDLFDIPFTKKTVWYRYVGTIKAGVDLSSAEFSQEGMTIKAKLDPPYIISNTPNMEKSGVLEERNNIFNPIHVEDVDEFQKYCVEQSEKEVLEDGLMDEAKRYAEQDISGMFNAALGDAYTVEFTWREQAEG